MHSLRFTPFLLGVLTVLALAWPAEARFVDPAGEMDLTQPAPVEVEAESAWSRLKSWAKDKIEVVKTEAQERGWIKSEKEQAEALAKKVQQQAGVEPAVTDELTAIAERKKFVTRAAVIDRAVNVGSV